MRSSPVGGAPLDWAKEGSRFRVQGSRFKVQGSRFKVQGCGGGSAANKDGRCPKIVFKLQVTSYKSLGTPNP